MTLRLYPLPSLFDPDVATVRSATPVDKSSFYVRRPYNVPWSALPTTFVFETSRPNDPHLFTINRTSQIAIVPGVETSSLQFQLSQGANRIEIETPNYAQRGPWSPTFPYNRFDAVGYGGTAWVALQPSVGVAPTEGLFWTLMPSAPDTRETLLVTVAATGVQAWLSALGREFYLSVMRRLREIENQLGSPWTTRISSHLLPFAELFLPARMPKIQQTRMAIAAIMGNRLGHGDGVIAMASAVSHSTPWVSKVQLSEFNVPGQFPDIPAVTTFATTGELQGRVLDIWSPNQCLASKLAITQLALSVGGEDVPEPKPLKLLDVNDYQLLLSVNGGPTEVHYINPLSPDCANIEFNTDCAGSIRVYAEFDGIMDVFMNTPQLPFDMIVESPISFGFWDEGNDLDMSTGSGSPGLGGGDDHFDTVDPDDPFGTGFAGVSLSRRLDFACLDTTLQRGQRMVKFIPPLPSAVSYTPDPSFDTVGTKLVINTTSPGAPSATAGSTTVWAMSPLNYVYEGDYIRLESPNDELVVASSWPVFEASSIIWKSTTGATVALSGSQRTVTTAAPFFEPKHEGTGIQVTIGMAISYASVVKVVSSTVAILGGNPFMGTGVATIDVYEPKRDPDAVGAPFAGHRVFQIELASALPITLVDKEQLDQRRGLLSIGSFLIGDTVVRVATDILPLPGDKLYFTGTDYRFVVMASDTGLVHHTTGLKVYDILLDSGSPVNLTDNQTLHMLSNDPCWPNGDPVTPLKLITMAPVGYLS